MLSKSDPNDHTEIRRIDTRDLGDRVILRNMPYLVNYKEVGEIKENIFSVFTIRGIFPAISYKNKIFDRQFVVDKKLTLSLNNITITNIMDLFSSLRKEFQKEFKTLQKLETIGKHNEYMIYENI